MNEIKRVLIHIRWPLQSFTTLGILFSMAVCRVSFSANLVFGIISWLLLCAGVTVYNSYYDKDEGPVAGLEKPPATTISMLIGAWILKIFGLIITLFLNKIFLGICVATIILSILYSHKSFRFKSNGYVAVFFNFIIGAMTFFIVTTFSQVDNKIIYFGSVSAGLFLSSIYLMMQIHQKDEDRVRGDISIAVLHGKEKTLISAIIFMFVAALLSLLSLYFSNFSWANIIILTIYFCLIFVFSYLWLKKEGNSFSDFKMMNKLTLNLSYAGNLIFLVTYILEILKI